ISGLFSRKGMHHRRSGNDLPFECKPQQPAQSSQITIDRAYSNASSLACSGEPGNDFRIDLRNLRVCQVREAQQTYNRSRVKLEAALFHMQSSIFEKPARELAQNGCFGGRRLGPGIERMNLAQADGPTVLVFDFFSFGLDLGAC